jgi:hypothetical protein
LKTFSAKESPKPDIQAVFFCFRIPRPDPATLDKQTGEPLWTESAGDTIWLLYGLDGKLIAPEPSSIANLLRSEPDTKRHCAFSHEDLIKLREKVEKDLNKSHLRPLQAPVGVKPVLKCWMEIN